MLLIVTPLRGWRRRVSVFRLVDATSEQLFTAYTTVSEAYKSAGRRGSVDISLVPIRVEQVGDWIDRNVDLRWWEHLLPRLRFSVHEMVYA